MDSTQTISRLTNRMSGKTRACAVVACLGLLALQVSAAPSPLNLAQKPLFLGGTDPNLMVILDASGSMPWSYIPDTIGRRALSGTDATVTAKTTHSASDCLTSGWKKGLTSSAYNQLYYDPNVTYYPPLNSDGTAMANASWTAAKLDGYSSSSSTLDLSKYYRATWGHSTNSSSTDVGSYCAYVDTALTGSSTRTAYYNNLTGTTSACTTINTAAAPPADTCFTTVTVSTTSGPSRARPELGGITSTNETINFANWFSYYRTRINTAKAGISRAFAKAGTNMYVGYGALNSSSTTVDGVTTNTIVRGVRPFKDYASTTDPFPSGTTYRSDFFTWLFAKQAGSGTPSREALNYAGKYYESSTAAYSSKPWSPSTGNDVSCRQSYTIMMSDGYWNGNAASTSGATANTDSTSAGLDSLDGKTLSTYSARAPFKDGFSSSGSLADVAMYYWKRDLRTDLTNNVPVGSDIDKAFWQHMTTFTIAFGLTGSIDKTKAFTSLQLAMSPTPDTANASYGYPSAWPDPTPTQNETRVDDLMHAAVNGHGGFYSARNPTEFANALTSTLEDIAGRRGSGSALSTNSGQISSNTRLYQALFDSSDWSGDVQAYSISSSGDVSSLPVAKASAALASFGNTASTRKVYTYLAGTGRVNFDTSSLSTAQRSAISTGISSAALDGTTTVDMIINYTRGARGNEQKNGGTLRNRGDGGTNYAYPRLGDIVNSDPVYAGKTNMGYTYLSALSSSARGSYASMFSSLTPAVFVGANDGMLHAFSEDLSQELFAYIPNNVIGNLPFLAKDPNFSHRYFVDGSITIGHAYLGGWKRILIGSTGAGGRAYFALDVTDPSNPSVLWEYTHAELGNPMGRASIVLLNDGTWAAVFGNGYNSDSGNASLFVLNLSTGALIKKLDVTSRDTSLTNGLSGVTAADVDGDGATDLIYAGDIQGDLWKFDLSSATSGNWSVSFGGNPLFQTPNTSGKQAITARPSVVRHPKGGVLVVFGTGKFVESGDQSNTDIQAIYGIRDTCALAAGAGCTSGVSTAKVSLGDLLQQSFTESGTTRILTANKDTTNSKKGFYFNLSLGSTKTGERVISEAKILADRAIITSMVPNEDVCGEGGDSWIYQFDLFTGGELSYSVFDLNGDKKFDSSDRASAVKVSGLMKGTSLLGASDNNNLGKIFSGSSNLSIQSSWINMKAPVGRQTWRQIR